MKTTRMREAISIENRVVMLLRRLGTKNGLFIVGEVYGVAKSTISKIVRTFCRLVRFHLQPVLVQFSSPTWFRVLAQEFEALHGILHIIKAIDGFHIPNFAPIIGGENYYYWESFHSVLVQDIVDTKYVFWDKNLKWARNMHD